MIKIKGCDNNYYTIMRSSTALFTCNLCFFNLSKSNRGYVICDKGLLRKVFNVGYDISDGTLCYHIISKIFKNNDFEAYYYYFKKLNNICRWKIYLDGLGGKNEIQGR